MDPDRTWTAKAAESAGRAASVAESIPGPSTRYFAGLAKRLLAVTDERFQGELTAAQFQSYLTWRDLRGTGAENPLLFLMKPHAEP